MPMKFSDILEKSDFFVVYPRFCSVHRDFQENYAHFLDKNTEHIKYAARAYFQHIFSKRGNVEVNTKAKETAGVQVSELKSRIWGN